LRKPRRADCRYEDGIPYLERALSIREETFGSNDAEVAAVARSLGNAYLVCGRATDAAGMLERALAISRAQHGEHSLNVAADMHRLALVYSVPGTYAKAEKNALSALSLREELLGINHPEVISLLKDIADIFAAEGKEEEAKEYETRAKSALMGFADARVAEIPKPAQPNPATTKKS